MQATARAHSNIALVKYWGKRADSPADLNLPATGSLSLTLDALHTTTSVAFDASLTSDRLVLDGEEQSGKALQRVREFLDRIRKLGDVSDFALVESANNFPTAAGLASSASSFAALTLAASRAAGLRLPRTRMSELARYGSGSAARSIFGGYVEMLRGRRRDGRDCHAVQLLDPGQWDLCLLVALTAQGPKAISSREAMSRTASSSPFFPAWVEGIPATLERARECLATRDFARLGPLVERNAMAMHATGFAADPPVLFWNPGTVAVLQRVASLRQEGLLGWCTMDAGPHVKVLCQPGDAPAFQEQLELIPGVLRVIACHPGPDADLLVSSSADDS